MLEFRDATLEEGVQASSSDRTAIRDVQDALSCPDSGGYTFVTADGKQHTLPEPLAQILRSAATMLLRGERVTLAPVSKELSTQEAANLLNVSRPYLVTLLDSGKIPFTKTGRNRRVRFGDVAKYRTERDRSRRERLQAMIRTSEDLGLYDLEEFDIDSPT